MNFQVILAAVCGTNITMSETLRKHLQLSVVTLLKFNSSDSVAKINMLNSQ
jgi:hypothetical protein